MFKISNPSEPVPVVDFQIAALEHIARVAPDQPVPRVVRTLDGRTRDSVTLADGVDTTVRMLTYLDGVQVPRDAPHRCAAPRNGNRARRAGPRVAGLHPSCGNARVCSGMSPPRTS